MFVIEKLDLKGLNYGLVTLIQKLRSCIFNVQRDFFEM